MNETAERNTSRCVAFGSTEPEPEKTEGGVMYYLEFQREALDALKSGIVELEKELEPILSEDEPEKDVYPKGAYPCEVERAIGDNNGEIQTIMDMIGKIRSRVRL